MLLFGIMDPFRSLSQVTTLMLQTIRNYVSFSLQGCHFSADRRISAFLLLLWAANCLISLFLSEKISSFLLANNQWSNVASKCSNIQSSSIHNINISIHTNLILFYSTIHIELQITFIFYKCVHKFMYWT